MAQTGVTKDFMGQIIDDSKRAIGKIKMMLLRNNNTNVDLKALDLNNIFERKGGVPKMIITLIANIPMIKATSPELAKQYNSEGGIFTGYNYDIPGQPRRVIKLNKGIFIPTIYGVIYTDGSIKYNDRQGEDKEIWNFPRIPAPPIIRNDITAGEYYSGYDNEQYIIESYVAKTSLPNTVCRHGTCVIMSEDYIVLVTYNMGIPVVLEAWSDGLLTVVINYDKHGYPSRIENDRGDGSSSIVHYTGPFANGKAVELDSGAISVEVNIEKDIIKGPFRALLNFHHPKQELLETKQSNEMENIKANMLRYAGSSKALFLRQVTQFNLYIRLNKLFTSYIKRIGGNTSIIVYGTLKPTRYIDNIEIYQGIEYHDIPNVTEGQVQLYIGSHDLDDFAYDSALSSSYSKLPLINEFFVKDGMKWGIERIHTQISECKIVDDILKELPHKCRLREYTIGDTNKVIIRAEVTLYWVDGVAVSEKEFLPIRAEFETMISQAITSEGVKIPLGGIITSYMGY